MTRASCTTSFPAMTTTVTVVSVSIREEQHRRAVEHIRTDVAGWERRFSRFRPDSMLSRINAADGRWTSADEIFLDLLETARDAVFATEGRFNPAVLPALAVHGYDRTIDDVRQGSRKIAPVMRQTALVDAWREVVIDRATMRVRLPDELRIDLGGVAKGALADLLADRFRHWPGGAVSIGGDLRAWGMPPNGDHWRVGIEHPLDPHRDIAVVTIPDGSCTAVATSSRTRRAWQTANGEAHHLIDPASGQPAASPLLAVSVCARTATVAEIVTKNLMVASAHGPLTGNLLLDAGWALTVSGTLDLARVTKEAA